MWLNWTLNPLGSVIYAQNAVAWSFLRNYFEFPWRSSSLSISTAAQNDEAHAGRAWKDVRWIEIIPQKYVRPCPVCGPKLETVRAVGQATGKPPHWSARDPRIGHFYACGQKGLGLGLAFSTCAGDRSERSGLLQTHGPWAPSTGLVPGNPRTNMLRAALCI